MPNANEMEKEINLIVEGAIVIAASKAKIWDVLTNVDAIKDYMFGSVVSTNWQPGSGITFIRNFNGTQFSDKGQILEVSPYDRLKFTYWSSQEGYGDISQNYSIITYTLEKESQGHQTLKYRREKIPLEFERKNQEKFLPGLLRHIKKLAEKE